MTSASELKSRWEELNAGVSEDIVKKWWTIIETNYSDPIRHYHTLDHIANMFRYFDTWKSKLNSTNMVAYAIFFHDLAYDPRSPGKNEEESSNLFKTFCEQAQLSEDTNICANVVHLVTLTNLTEEHKQLNVYGLEDEHYFLDFDMAILGSCSDEYDAYAEKIKQEYSFLPDKSYKDLRAKVLKSFLQIPKIFATEEFHTKYEMLARDNINREISRLN